MDQVQATKATLKGAAMGYPRPRGWFHVGVSGVLLLLVVVGFSPTFFLRSAFTDRPLPLYLCVQVSTCVVLVSLGTLFLVVRTRTAEIVSETLSP